MSQVLSIIGIIRLVLLHVLRGIMARRLRMFVIFVRINVRNVMGLAWISVPNVRPMIVRLCSIKNMGIISVLEPVMLEPMRILQLLHVRLVILSARHVRGPATTVLPVAESTASISSSKTEHVSQPARMGTI